MQKKTANEFARNTEAFQSHYARMTSVFFELGEFRISRRHKDSKIRHIDILTDLYSSF